MGGSFALNRDIASAWKDPNQTCRWACDVPLGNNGPNGVWSLSYESGLGFWQVWADMSANAPADIVTYLPNAITAQPKSPEGYHWVQDNWKCLGKNTLPIAAGGLGFPPTVQVQPLWA